MMSEMKPFIWMDKAHRAEFDGVKGDLGLTVPAWNDSLNQYAKSKGLKPMDVPLYTAEQLAEAVAAERERVLNEVEARVDAALPKYGIDIAFGDLCKILEAIRSAAE